MRIVHICQRDDPDIGGSLRVAEALVREQRKLGVDAWILFLYGKPGVVAIDFGYRAVCLELHSSRQAFKGIFALKKAIQQINPDIIHSHDGILWPRLTLLRLHIPVVMHAHLPMGTSAKGLSWILIKKTTDVLIGISQHTINTWVNAGYPSDRIHYIQNGVDLDRFGMADTFDKQEMRRKLGLPSNRKILLWLGRLHRSMKGVDRIECIARMLPEDTVLVIVGNGPDYAGLLKRNTDLLLAEKMIMTGSTPVPQDYYKAADGFLFTSHHEPFGLVILEAAACGIPILSFPVDQGGGATDLLHEFDSCEINDDATEVEVDEAIRRVYANASFAMTLRERIKTKYSWAIKAEQVQGVYQKVLGMSQERGDLKLKVLVCQHGARHRYAIPRMLGESEVLRAFYTDSSEKSWIGQCVRFMGILAPPAWKNFSRWNIEGVPREKIYSSDYSYFIELVQQIFRVSKTGIQLYHQRHTILSARMQKWGLQGANIVYSMYHENLKFIRWAKSQGALSAVDVFISPLTDRIMEEEYKAFPNWVVETDDETIAFEHKLWKETVEVADVLICPSEWVAEGVRSLSPEVTEKVRVVPYGCSINYQGRVNRPVKGRILFAGRDPLRKGLQYLAQATTDLKKSLPSLDVRIAGELPQSVINHPLCNGLNFLGQLDGEQMKDEFLTADALVLPALSEGFAGVVAEAIGAGCPVIVTKEAGSPVVDGREGIVIPSKDVDALASAIRRMVEDRDFRSSCAANCLKQVSFYSEQQWKQRLIMTLEDSLENSR